MAQNKLLIDYTRNVCQIHNMSEINSESTILHYKDILKLEIIVQIIINILSAIAFVSIFLIQRVPNPRSSFPLETNYIFFLLPLVPYYVLSIGARLIQYNLNFYANLKQKKLTFVIELIYIVLAICVTIWYIYYANSYIANFNILSPEHSRQFNRLYFESFPFYIILRLTIMGLCDIFYRPFKNFDLIRFVRILSVPLFCVLTSILIFSADYFNIQSLGQNVFRSAILLFPIVYLGITVADFKTKKLPR